MRLLHHDLHPRIIKLVLSNSRKSLLQRIIIPLRAFGPRNVTSWLNQLGDSYIIWYGPLGVSGLFQNFYYWLCSDGAVVWIFLHLIATVDFVMMLTFCSFSPLFFALTFIISKMSLLIRRWWSIVVSFTSRIFLILLKWFLTWKRVTLSKILEGHGWGWRVTLNDWTVPINTERFKLILIKEQVKEMGLQELGTTFYNLYSIRPIKGIGLPTSPIISHTLVGAAFVEHRNVKCDPNVTMCRPNMKPMNN